MGSHSGSSFNNSCMLVDILDPPSLKNFLKICHLQSFRRLLTLLGIWGDVSVASRLRLAQITALLLVILMLPAIASAHNVSNGTPRSSSRIPARRSRPFLYLGAKHMVTGYDHLLFLVGVIFFLYRMKDVVQYVSLFTIGHSLTLLGGVLGGVHAEPVSHRCHHRFLRRLQSLRQYGRIQTAFRFSAQHRLAVLIFGLFHGFGLATKLQEFTLAKTAWSQISSVSMWASKSDRCSH